MEGIGQATLSYIDAGGTAVALLMLGYMAAAVAWRLTSDWISSWRLDRLIARPLDPEDLLRGELQRQERARQKEEGAARANEPVTQPGEEQPNLVEEVQERQELDSPRERPAPTHHGMSAEAASLYGRTEF